MSLIFHSNIGTKFAERIQYKISVATLHFIDWTTRYHSIKVSSMAIIIQQWREALDVNPAIYFLLFCWKDLGT